jgi:hypothetical protein
MVRKPNDLFWKTLLIVSATAIVGAAIAERATTIRGPSWGRGTGGVKAWHSS